MEAGKKKSVSSEQGLKFYYKDESQNRTQRMARRAEKQKTRELPRVGGTNTEAKITTTFYYPHQKHYLEIRCTCKISNTPLKQILVLFLFL